MKKGTTVLGIGMLLTMCACGAANRVGGQGNVPVLAEQTERIYEEGGVPEGVDMERDKPEGAEPEVVDPEVVDPERVKSEGAGSEVVDIERGKPEEMDMEETAPEVGPEEAATRRADSKEADGQETEEMRTSQRPVPKRMVMVKGTLYVDTGYVSGIWGRCGTLDGNIEVVIDSMKIPEKDGQANFQTNGWQMGFEKDTIEIPIDGEWCIFAARGSKEDGYIPEGVAQFLATVEEVTDDGYVIVKTDMGVSEMFRRKIKENERYKISLEHYTCDINIPVEALRPGNVLSVVCKNNVEGADPAMITDVYSVSPLHGNVDVCQYPPVD